jgi:uncharacterized protein YerC
MLKSLLGLVFALGLVAGCAAPQQSAAPQAAANQPAAVATVDSAPTNDAQDYDTVFVPPPVGSLLGGGSVRVAKNISGSDEKALLGNIRHLNAAAGSQNERPFVVKAVSKVTGVSERNLQAQQDRLQLRFGELCAINAIAHGNDTKVQEIASLKARGRTWTDIAKANGLSITTVAQVTRNASELTISSYSNTADRAKGGEQKLKEMGVRPQPNVRPGG